MIAFLAVLFLPFSLLAQTMDPAYGIVIDESFEKGIPADWTQENVSGSVNWVGESQNLTYPNGASDSLARIAFRNTSGVTNKAVTRLVLPAVDVAALFQPVLIFSHAQDKWSGDFDSLRILCRTSADGEWKTLTAYDNYIAKWQRDTIFLPAAAYCQIAFEAADNLGRGVVIDDVVVRSTPSCFDPEALYTSNVTNNSITVNWQGSFDAEYFYVKLSKDTLTAAQLESSTTELVCDTTTDGVSMDFEGLIQGTKYYCYVKSQCEHEISGWVSIEFKTANLVNIPDTITFNLPADPDKKGEFAYLDGWYYDAATPEYKPGLNAYGSDWKYGGSYDGSGSLVFSYYVSSGKVTPNSYLGALPAGTWAYAATPEMNANVKDLQISFETFIYYRYVAEQFGITVGVMTDPEDRSTFVPVKTLINDRPFIWQDYTVSFENYTGNGKYIAFMSDFEKTNHFTIENLVIEPRKEVNTLNFDIMMPTASTMQFKFDEAYDSYEIVLCPMEYTIDRNNDFPDTLDYISKHTIQNMGVIENLNPGDRYIVYARGVKGDKKTRWPYPQDVKMPSRFDVNTFPYFIDFENISTTTSAAMNGYTASSVVIPTIIKPLFTYITQTFKMEDSASWVGKSWFMPEPLGKKEFTIGCYYSYPATTIAVFPEVDMSTTKVSFWAVGRMSSASMDPASASNQKNYKAKAAIGVMTDANDINSFIAIDTIEPSYLEYTYYEYDFSLFPEAKGNFFAIQLSDYDFDYANPQSYTNKIAVDNMTFAKSVDCKSPSNMKAEVDVYDPSKATITWDANGSAEWNIKVATTEYDRTQFGNTDSLEFVFEGKVTAPKAEITGLKYPNQTYYYWLQPICSSVEGEWSAVAGSFETFCPAIFTVPYVQDFENVEVGSNVYTGFAAECLYTKQWTRAISGLPSSYMNKYYYPYVTNTIAYSGENSLPLFKKYTSTSRNYIALPELDKPIDSLQMTFRLYSHKTSSSYWNAQELAVGVMTDPMDINTFEQVALVKPSKATTWERVLVNFEEYKGNGKYIAIRETDKFTSNPSYTSDYAKGKNTDSVYVDKIEVNVAPPCDIPYDIVAFDVTPNSAQLKWVSDASSFIVVVTDKALTFGDLVDLDDYKAGTLASFVHAASIISVDTIEGAKSSKLSGLTINKDYYVYIKSFCQGMYTDYSDEYVFSTYCPAVSPETFFANFEDGTTGQLPDCWFAGKTHGVYSGTNTITNFLKIQSAGAFPAQGKAIYMTSTNGSINTTTGQANPNGIYLIAPIMDIDNIADYKVKFKAWTTSSYGVSGCGSNDYARSVIIGVVTNPFDMSTFMPVDTVDNIFYDPYPYEVYLEDYQFDMNGDTGKFVAFYSNFGIRNNIYFDDVELELIDDCPRFEGKVESKTTSSVTLKFNSVPASYEVKASTKLDEAYMDTTDLPSATSTTDVITIDSLTAHTEYYFYARSTADSTCQDWHLVLVTCPADFTERDIPFIDGFETNRRTASYGICPHDWYGFYANGNVSYPNVVTTAKAGNRGVNMYPTTTGSPYLVSPKLNVDKLGKCYLEFSYYHTSITAYTGVDRALTVGVVSDPNNIVATFEPIDTLLIPYEKLGTWFTAQIDLSSYTGDAKHIAFFTDFEYNKSLFPTYSYCSFTIDEVIVDYIPTCYSPVSFVAENVSDREITMTFDHDGALRYEAMYCYHSFDPTADSLPSEVKTISFTGTEFTIDSLFSERSYEIYVRAICSEQDASEWKYAGRHTTLPSLISEFPYYNDFSDEIENANWKFHSSTSVNWYMGVDNDSLVADQKNSTDAALYYSVDGGKTAVGTNKSGWVAKTYRYIELKEGVYNFSFDWICPSQPRVTTSQAIFEQGLLRAFILPSNTTFSSAAAFKNPEGKSLSMSYIDPLTQNLLDGFYELSNVVTWGKEYGALFGTDLSLPLDQQWQRRSKTLTITKEQEGTYMILFFYYSASKAPITENGFRAAVIDNLTITKAECGYVYNVKVDDKTFNSAKLSWNTSDSTLASYDVLVLNENVDPNTATDAQKVYTGTAASTSATVTGLNAFTTYYAFVRPTCASESNPWGDLVEFTTEVNVPEGYVFSFEEEDMLYYPEYTNGYVAELTGDEKYKNKTTLFHKWLTMSMIEENNTSPTNYQYNQSYASYHPQVVQDTLSGTNLYTYGRTGKRALWLGSRTTNSFINGATVALPYAGEFDGKRLIFYMRCFHSYASKTTPDNDRPSFYYPTYFSSSINPNNQSRKITVGTMTDPNDDATFVALDTVQYPYTGSDYSNSTYYSKKDPSGDKGWARAVVSLANAKGKYIAFRFEHYGTTTADKTLNMYIDDVVVERIPECPAPELVIVDDLNATSATISYTYEGVPTVDVEVATDENFANVVLRDTFNTIPFTITGLQPLTKYYLRSNVICSDLDVSNYSKAISFETPEAICYDNNFDAETTHYPTNWLHCFSYTLYNVLKGSSYPPMSQPSSGNTWGWKLKPAIFASGKFASQHLVAMPATTSSSSSTMWASTPIFELDDVADQHLSFDLALTENGTNNPADLSMSEGDTTLTFAVWVNVNGSSNCKREDLTLWKMEVSKMKPEYNFAEIPHRGGEYSIDLSKYKGKNVQIYFYYQCGQHIDLHLDNVHINRYAEKEYKQTICEFCDYEDNNFFILSSNTEVGENKFTKWEFENENPDTLLVLNLNVTDAPETEIEATICAGDVYNEKGFTGLMETGVYRQKFISSNGCDSIVSLALNVVAPVYTTVVDTICWGTKYSFNGKEYDRTGIYIDTLVSVLTGCDSIVTLALSVADVIRTEQYVNICFGETYTLGSQTISATGKYEELFKTADGCDSLVILHATMLPEYKHTINAVIKEGEEYNENGFKGLTVEGEYTLPLKSVDGCDSVITLNLKVLDGVTNEVSINICFGDSYVFGSQTITESGQYTETFKTAEGGDSTVLLTATVLPDFRQTLEATICAGEVYNENGFENLGTTGVYTQELKSVDGCDSTITLNLTVLSGDTTRVDAKVKTDELPYEYRDLYYDKSTRPGTYVDTIIVETENCEEVIIHTLVVEAGTAVDNVSSHDLVMVPNPVTVNGTLYINAEFTTEERDGLVVEVFNSIGQRVYVEYPSIYPIEVTGLSERGMYIVRIIAGNGKSYQGKIIVE